MAEFEELVKNQIRMCESHTLCVSCPLGYKRFEYHLSCHKLIRKHPEEIEKIVMAWAKEHPAHTNADKFKEVFGEDARKYCKYSDWWDEEYKAPTEEE